MITDRKSAALALTIATEIVKTVLIGIALGVVFYGLVFAWDAFHHMSAAAQFEQIQFGMSRAAVITVLQQKDILCASREAAEDAAQVCRFSDFWRTYTVTFDPASGQVVRKYFWFKQRRALTLRIIDWMRAD